MDVDPDADGTGLRTAGLATLLQAAAATLENAGELARLTVTLRPEDSMVELTSTSAAPMPDRRASIDRLVAVAVTPGRVWPDHDRTTTGETSAMLRALVPWASTLRSGQVDELAVFDHGRDHSDHSVHLVLRESADPLHAVEVVTAALPARVESRALGSVARAMLPTGYYLKVVATALPRPAQAG